MAKTPSHSVTTMRTEYIDSVAHYTVYDQWGLIVIATTNYGLAKRYFALCSYGHSARTLYIQSLGPAARYRYLNRS